jgi:ABC-2 type transport system ATP-binding protein
MLARVPGVVKVTAVDRHGTSVGYEIDTAGERDVRRDLAREIVGSGLGLLELRPMRISLEEIFLQLTTDEQRQAPVEPVEPLEPLEPAEPAEPTEPVQGDPRA